MTELHHTRVVLYARASTKNQAEDGVSFETQHQAMHSVAQLRGWEIVAQVDEQVSGGAKDRPKRAAAVQLIESGAADALVVHKLDRVSRSVVDFAALVGRAKSKGWALIVLDPELDMTTPAGELTANVLIAVAQFERQIIGSRTKEALAVKRANGVKLGRRSTVPEPVIQRIIRERAAGGSLPQIASGLNQDAIPTATGQGAWYPSTVRAILFSQAAGNPA